LNKKTWAAVSPCPAILGILSHLQYLSIWVSFQWNSDPSPTTVPRFVGVGRDCTRRWRTWYTGLPRRVFMSSTSWNSPCRQMSCAVGDSAT